MGTSFPRSGPTASTIHSRGRTDGPAADTLDARGHLQQELDDIAGHLGSVVPRTLLVDHGYYLSYLGRAREGLAIALKAMRLNPYYPEWYVVNLIQIHFDAREYENAIAAFERLRTETPLALVYLSASYAALNRLDEAGAAVARLLTLDPGASLEKWTRATVSPYKLAEDSQHLRDHLEKAGLPPG